MSDFPSPVRSPSEEVARPRIANPAIVETPDGRLEFRDELRSVRPIAGATLSLTTRCNANCAICIEPQRPPGPPGELPRESALALAEFFSGRVPTVMSCAGEAILYPHFLDFARAVTAHGTTLAIGTNGLAFARPRVLGDALDAGLGSILLSCHALSADDFDVITGTRGQLPVFEGALRNVASAMAERPDLDVTLELVVTKRILGHLAEYLDTVRALFPGRRPGLRIETMRWMNQALGAPGLRPDLADVATVAAEAIALARPDFELTFSYVPLCLLRGHETFASESARILARDAWLGNRSVDSTEIVEWCLLGNALLSPTHAPICRGCTLRHFCPGVFDVPVPDAAPWPRPFTRSVRGFVAALGDTGDALEHRLRLVAFDRDPEANPALRQEGPAGSRSTCACSVTPTAAPGEGFEPAGPVEDLDFEVGESVVTALDRHGWRRRVTSAVVALTDLPRALLLGRLFAGRVNSLGTFADGAPFSPHLLPWAAEMLARGSETTLATDGAGLEQPGRVEACHEAGVRRMRLAWNPTSEAALAGATALGAWNRRVPETRRFAVSVEVSITPRLASGLSGWLAEIDARLSTPAPILRFVVPPGPATPSNEALLLDADGLHAFVEALRVQSCLARARFVGLPLCLLPGIEHLSDDVEHALRGGFVVGDGHAGKRDGLVERSEGVEPPTRAAAVPCLECALFLACPGVQHLAVRRGSRWPSTVRSSSLADIAGRLSPPAGADVLARELPRLVVARGLTRAGESTHAAPTADGREAKGRDGQGPAPRMPGRSDPALASALDDAKAAFPGLRVAVRFDDVGLWLPGNGTAQPDVMVFHGSMEGQGYYKVAGVYRIRYAKKRTRLLDDVIDLLVARLSPA